MAITESERDLHCRLQTSFAATDSLREQWDNAVIRLGGSIYMSYDWCRTWWEFYGTGKELRIFLFTSADKIVGILPLYIDSLGWGPLRFGVARLVGANIPPKVFDPAIDEEFSEKIFDAVLSQLFREDKCDLLSLGPVSSLHQSSERLEAACAARKDLVAHCRSEPDGVHTIFWLPQSMEDYFDGLSKNERKNRRKYELRLLSKEFTAKVDIVSDPARVEEEFDHFVQQHTLHWVNQGKPGHFGAWPRATEFNRALVRAHGKLGRMRFIRILANDQVIANQYTFAFGNSYWWELPARAVGQEWERFSLGPTGIVTMIAAAINEGKARLEGGLAHYDYKLRLGAKEYAVKKLRVLANRSGSARRMRVYELCRLVLSYGYHKVWYRRVSPVLPKALRGPLWTAWLRLDF
jgi:CelD/BcsL family acetyltransferase involved in cellulose biosynthesis